MSNPPSKEAPKVNKQAFREKKLTPETCVDGLAVWYSPSYGYAFAGIVDGEPWRLGEHTWVVHLREMEEGYGKFRSTSGATRVKAAALH